MNVAWVLFGLAACYASGVTADGVVVEDNQGPVAEFRGYGGYGHGGYGHGGYGHGGYGHGGYGHGGYRGYGYTPSFIPGGYHGGYEGYRIYRNQRQSFGRDSLKSSSVYPIYPPGYYPGYYPGFGY